VRHEEEPVFGEEAAEGGHGGALLDSSEGGEGEEFGEEMIAGGGAGKARLVIDGEGAESVEDGAGEEAGALSEGVIGPGVREDFRVPDPARGRAALEDEAIGGRNAFKVIFCEAAHFPGEPRAGRGLDQVRGGPPA